MPETIHLLLDTADPEADDLRRGLDDLLQNNGSLVFRFHNVSTEGLSAVLDKAKNTGEKNELSPEELEWIEPSYPSDLDSLLVEEQTIFQKLPPPRPAVSWEDLFDFIQQVRPMRDIPQNELAILLTPSANENNWFSSFRSSPAPEGFVQTTDWEFFMRAPRWFPVAHEIWTLILQLKGFGSLRNTLRYAHKSAVGCLNDFCEEKSDIHIKLRTADICDACLEVMLRRDLTQELLAAATPALEKIRLQSKFLQQRFAEAEASPLFIDEKGVLHFENYQQLSCRLAPVEKAVYLFFLLHPEGTRLNELSDYKQEILDLYLCIRNQDISAAVEVVRKLVNPLNNSANEKISRINAKLEQLLCLPGRYEHYQITHTSGTYAIPLVPEKIRLHARWDLTSLSK
ncbi:MAG: hypothetical protein JJU35_12405 [Balneolales bacterium]|nr:hypothetical protein [Balneolales bacterium]